MVQRQRPGVMSGHGQDIERDVVGGCLADQSGEGFGAGAKALLQRGEVQPAPGPDHGFAVDHTPRGHLGRDGRHEFREVPGQVLALPGPQCGSVIVTDSDGPVAVPLGLENRAAGEGVDPRHLRDGPGQGDFHRRVKPRRQSGSGRRTRILHRGLPARRVPPHPAARQCCCRWPGPAHRMR